MKVMSGREVQRLSPSGSRVQVDSKRLASLIVRDDDIVWTHRKL